MPACRRCERRLRLAAPITGGALRVRGSVVTGTGDIGCNCHKNRLGQAKVADFLEPKLRANLGARVLVEQLDLGGCTVTVM